MSRKLLEKVYAELHQEAYQWSRQCVNYSDALAEDVLQTVYLKILNGKAKYNQRSSLKTWLFSVIRFTAVDAFRSSKHQVSLEVVSDQTEELPLEALDEDFYTTALQQLSKNQSQVLLLVFYHNYTLEAVAEVMGLSIGTVRTHYDRGKKKLKQVLQKEKNTNYDYKG